MSPASYSSYAASTENPSVFLSMFLGSAPLAAGSQDLQVLFVHGAFTLARGASR